MRPILRLQANTLPRCDDLCGGPNPLEHPTGTECAPSAPAVNGMTMQAPPSSPKKPALSTKFSAVRKSTLPRWAPAACKLTAVVVCLAWAFWPTLETMADRWAHNPQYSHGFLVPAFAGVLLWQRRRLLPQALAPSWWGLPFIIVAGAMRWLGAIAGVQAVDGFALLPTLAGLALLLAGWPALRWAWPAIAFLGFMLPLPFIVETALAHPLQRVATMATTYVLQTLGLPALPEGNIICIDEIRLGVVGACSGLGMMMTFFALSTAVAIFIDRRLTDKLVIVASAIPIAVIANVVRITATGIVHRAWGQDAGNLIHDWAGWLMMPLALFLLWLEMKYLDHLLLDVRSPDPLPIDLAGKSFFGGSQS
jgi:exosortase